LMAASWRPARALAAAIGGSRARGARRLRRPGAPGLRTSCGRTRRRARRSSTPWPRALRSARAGRNAPPALVMDVGGPTGGGVARSLGALVELARSGPFRSTLVGKRHPSLLRASLHDPID
jgi:hypothetical protein